MSNKIDYFRGKYAFLSNFYRCEVLFEGLTYPSSENAFQAAKTLNISARSILTLPEITPSMSKDLGRAFDLRPNWDTIKLVTMQTILESKFQNPTLAQLLLDTGDAELIEGNTWNDTYWGICNGKGKNFLGKLLMELRKKLAATAKI